MKRFRVLVKTLITAIFLALTTPCIVSAETNLISEDGVKLSPSSVACFGSSPGKCKSGDEYISYDEYVSKFANQPSHVESVFHFKGRDDKVILEYISVEMAFVKRSVQNISSYMINSIALSDKDQYLQEQKKHALEQCPVKNGCKQLLKFIEELKSK
jgi:hypothetical protein